MKNGRKRITRNFHIISDDVLQNEIFGYLSAKEIGRFSLTNKYYNSLCQDDITWQVLIKRDFSEEGVDFGSPYKEMYITWYQMTFPRRIYLSDLKVGDTIKFVDKNYPCLNSSYEHEIDKICRFRIRIDKFLYIAKPNFINMRIYLNGKLSIVVQKFDDIKGL